ncbi:hypothetical protein [Paludibaculum fermentans]|uniref:hypothetical protein n=1 Tax=Paludibaculum fermentans TaxID=1473598 RepID=UPI003EBED73F
MQKYKFGINVRQSQSKEGYAVVVAKTEEEARDIAESEDIDWNFEPYDHPALEIKAVTPIGPSDEDEDDEDEDDED